MTELSPWIYNDEPFTQSAVPADVVGFVYVITNTLTNKKYVGKKLLWKTIVRPPLKGQKRKRRTVIPSDWETYVSSSEEVRRQIAEYGVENFQREILHFARSKGMLSYLEAKTQFDLNVLLDDSYLNGIIQCRINSKHLK